MFSVSTVRDSTRNDTQQLRDIQELIAQLDDVNKKLSFPVRAATPPAPPRESQPVDAPRA